MSKKLNRTVVLHVTESFGGGVATALTQHVSSMPGVEHHLLMGEREGTFADSGELSLFKSITILPGAPISAMKEIRRAYGTIRPSVVHAHSSFAGAFVRASLRASKRCHIVYTPHGYSFERKDIRPTTRAVLAAAELILSLNTSVTAACSPRELKLTKRLNRRIPTVYIPNVATVRQEGTPSVHIQQEPQPHHTIAAVGRITAARDPLFFRDMVIELRKTHPSSEAVWIGGGEPELVAELEHANIRVTGWLNRTQALMELGPVDLHVHTAAWDGFPMVILEANALRIPSIVRPLDAFSHLDRKLTAATPLEMAQKVSNLLGDKPALNAMLAKWDTELVHNTQEVQAERLRTAYNI